MQGKRLERVNQLIKEEVSTLLQRELKDPRLGFVTVTDVETTKDLRSAKVFVSVLGGEEQWKAILDRRELVAVLVALVAELQDAELDGSRMVDVRFHELPRKGVFVSRHLHPVPGPDLGTGLEIN